MEVALIVGHNQKFMSGGVPKLLVICRSEHAGGLGSQDLVSAPCQEPRQPVIDALIQVKAQGHQDRSSSWFSAM